MRRTHLYETHLRLGGRMVDFAGWELPVQYPAGPIQEHHAVRQAAGLFDIDHMGQFELTGPDAELYLQLIQTADIASMDVMEARYSLLTYGDGTVADDIFLYRLPERWLIVVNAANRDKDFAWLSAHRNGFDIALSDISDDLYMMALQGPLAETILQPLVGTDLSGLAARRAVETSVEGAQALIGRTGYTGEDGFELYLPAGQAVSVWDALLAGGRDRGLLPCGLAARDSLRFEACMPLYGHEIDATTTPIEARLGWAIHWDHDFIGRTALLKVKLEGSARRLVGFEMIDRAVPREHYPITFDGVAIGHVTSGMKAPTLDRFLGMAYVSAPYTAIGSEFDVMVRGQPKKAKVVKRPFYRPRYK